MSMTEEEYWKSEARRFESWFYRANYLRAQQEADNVELRKLVRDMWRFTGTACKKYPRLFDPFAPGGQTVQLNAIDAFEQRMRALGIEVPDGDQV